jgi:hypothetical protein
LYISTFVSHKDRAGFIDEPKTSSSLRKIGLTSMATNSQYLNGQLSDAQIEQLIQSLRGIKPVENDILDAEKTVNKLLQNKYKLFSVVLT